MSLLKYLDPMEKQKREAARAKEKKKKDEHTVQMTEVEAFFIMKGKRTTSSIKLFSKNYYKKMRVLREEYNSFNFLFFSLCYVIIY